jgi:carbonyl reductase 1
MAVTEALLPSLLSRAASSPAGARVINVCSLAGKQRILRDEPLRQRFAAASSATEVRSLMEEFIGGIERGDYAARGWPQRCARHGRESTRSHLADLVPLIPHSMYGVSKLGEAAYSCALAAQLRSIDANIIVAAACPGWCATDMSSQSGPKTAAQGADTPTWLSLAPPGFPSGRFWADRREESY